MNRVQEAAVKDEVSVWSSPFLSLHLTLPPPGTQDITPKVQRKPSMQRLKPTTPADPTLASPETRRRAEQIRINVGGYSSVPQLLDKMSPRPSPADLSTP